MNLPVDQECDNQILPELQHLVHIIISATLCWLQFVATLVANIEALTGSPVNVTIKSFKAGSVVANIETDVLDNNMGTATTLSNVLKSGDPSSVFGTGYGSVSVDPNSVKTVQVSNPARTSL